MAQIYAEYIYEVNIIGVGEKKKRICTYYFGAYKPRLCKLIVLSRKWNQVFIYLRAAERVSLRDPPPPRVYSALLPHERNACIFSTSEMHPRILTALNAATAGTVNKTVTILSGESLCRASLCGWGKQGGLRCEPRFVRCRKHGNCTSAHSLVSIRRSARTSRERGKSNWNARKFIFPRGALPSLRQAYTHLKNAR